MNTSAATTMADAMRITVEPTCRDAGQRCILARFDIWRQTGNWFSRSSCSKLDAVAAHLPSQSPWVFRFAKYLIKRRYRGGFRLLDTAGRLGLLNTVVRYSLSPVVTLGVPLYRPENQFDRDELLTYEHDVICAVVRCLRAYDGPVVLCDCGADIGLFSALVLAKLPSISALIAFEPNPHAYEILK